MHIYIYGMYVCIYIYICVSRGFTQVPYSSLSTLIVDLTLSMPALYLEGCTPVIKHGTWRWSLKEESRLYRVPFAGSMLGCWSIWSVILSRATSAAACFTTIVALLKIAHGPASPGCLFFPNCFNTARSNQQSPTLRASCQRVRHHTWESSKKAKGLLSGASIGGRARSSPSPSILAAEGLHWLEG